MMKKISLASVIIISFALLANGQYTKLYDFTRTVDIQHPLYTQFVSDGTWLYGATVDGGSNNFGALFRFKPDGSGYEKIHDFTGTPDGASPAGGLTIVDNKLYGTTTSGGLTNAGIIFRINTDGSNYSKILDFEDESKGTHPYGAVIESSGVLYGMTTEGGSQGGGCVYRVNTDGSEFERLKDFVLNGIDGSTPYGALTLADDILYGMTISGGSDHLGCIFNIKTDGTAYKKMFDFKGYEKGEYPYGSLTLAGDMLYGMTNMGGATNTGCIFKINKNTNEFTNLFDFNVGNGRLPEGSLIIADSMLYGTTFGGGEQFHNGTVFKIKIDGKDFKTLYEFDGVLDGKNPRGSLFLKDGILYGTTYIGGAEGLGNIFSLKTDGTDYKNLLSCGLPGNGAQPQGITVSGDIGYGITYNGGLHDIGSIFKINTNGTGYSKLYDFDGSNGYNPYGALVINGNTLYGTASAGGANGDGCVFSVNTSGTGFKTLFSFEHTQNGAIPLSTLVLSGNSLYGMTFSGGVHGFGIIYKINTDGSNFKKLFDFDQTNGANPIQGLVLSQGMLYGVTVFGGNMADGNIFKIDTTGNNFVNLHTFSILNDGLFESYGTPVVIGNVLYGTAEDVPSGKGTIYKINTDGTGFERIKALTNEEGSDLQSPLTVVDNIIYGAANDGGSHEAGTIFKYNTVTNEFAKIWDFDSINGGRPRVSPLFFSAGALYGGTSKCGVADKGVIYRFTLTQETKVNNLTENNIRIYPNPFGNHFKIENDVDFSSVSILDIYGRMVTAIQTPEKREYDVTVNNLKPGTYLLILKDKDGNILGQKHVEKVK